MTNNSYDWEVLMQGIDEKKPNVANPRIENQRLLLTYKTHIDKCSIKEFITSVYKKECARIEVAHEVGKSKGIDYPHTHVAIDFGAKYVNKSKNCMMVFDYEGIHPNIKVISYKKHWDNTMRYLAKEDPDNSQLLKEFGDPSKSMRDVLEGISQCKDAKEALMNFADHMSEIVPVSVAYNVMKIDSNDFRTNKKELDINGRQWYKPLLALDSIPPDDRSIHWFYDPVGGRGKTVIGHYMEDNFDQRWIVLSSLGQQKDSSLLIHKELMRGWKQHGVIIDLDRKSSEYESIYASIEGIKNGMLTGTKYEGKRMRFNSPHVVIFSNRMPIVNALSYDRWRIWKIENDNFARLVTSTQDVNDLLDEDRDLNTFSQEEINSFAQPALQQNSATKIRYINYHGN